MLHLVNNFKVLRLMPDFEILRLTPGFEIIRQTEPFNIRRQTQNFKFSVAMRLMGSAILAMYARPTRPIERG